LGGCVVRFASSARAGGECAVSRFEYRR
jgi:hypothetical protein